MRPGHPCQFVADVIARAADGDDLRVLRQAVVHLGVARGDLRVQALVIDQSVARQRVHRLNKLAQGVQDDEVLAVIEESLH